MVACRIYVVCATGFISALVLCSIIGYGTQRDTLLQNASQSKTESRLLRQLHKSQTWAKAHAGGEPLIKQWSSEYHKLFSPKVALKPHEGEAQKQSEGSILSSIESLLLYGVFGMNADRHAKKIVPQVKQYQLAQSPKSKGHAQPKLIEVLPGHWRSYLDVSTARPFYYNTRTKRSQWTFPQLSGSLTAKPEDFDAEVTKYIFEGGKGKADAKDEKAKQVSKPKVTSNYEMKEGKGQQLKQMCGMKACDPFKGCDSSVFAQCILHSGSNMHENHAAQSESVKAAARGCGGAACNAKMGCNNDAFFACLIRNSNAAIREAVSEGFVDFPRDGVDFSHGFDDARSVTTAQAPLPSIKPVLRRATAAAPAIIAPQAVKKIHSTRQSSKGVFAPHSLEPSTQAVVERAELEREIKATADSIFNPDPLTAFAADSSRFPSLTGHQLVSAAGDPTPATKSEVSEILRHTIKDGPAEARSARVPWDRAVHGSFPPPWREDTTRDHEANQALLRAGEQKDQLLNRALRPAPGQRRDQLLNRALGPAHAGAAGKARFVALADVGGDESWRRMTDKGGRAYWLNSRSGVTQWHSPSQNALRDTERSILKATLKAGEVEGDPAQTVVAPAHVHKDLDALRSIMSS